jgi:hypothetical protein
VLLCRTKAEEVVRPVALAALAEVRPAAEGAKNGDEILAALLKQEADRLNKVLTGASIVVLVFSLNLVGEGLRDLLDPHRRNR